MKASIPSKALAGSNCSGSLMYYVSDVNKLKDYLPIIYTGHHDLVASKLVLLCAELRKKYSLQFFLVLNDAKEKSFTYDFVLSKTKFDTVRTSFKKMCFCKEEEGGDAVLKFMEQNDLKINICNSKRKFDVKHVVGYFGDEDSYSKIKNKLDFFGKNVVVTNDIQKLCDECDVICGNECAEIVMAAALGKQIYLLNMQKKENSFQIMFPDAIILS